MGASSEEDEPENRSATAAATATVGASNHNRNQKSYTNGKCNNHDDDDSNENLTFPLLESTIKRKNNKKKTKKNSHKITRFLATTEITEGANDTASTMEESAGGESKDKKLCEEKGRWADNSMDQIIHDAEPRISSENDNYHNDDNHHASDCISGQKEPLDHEQQQQQTCSDQPTAATTTTVSSGCCEQQVDDEVFYEATTEPTDESSVTCHENHTKDGKSSSDIEEDADRGAGESERLGNLFLSTTSAPPEQHREQGNGSVDVFSKQQQKDACTRADLLQSHFKTADLVQNPSLSAALLNKSPHRDHATTVKDKNDCVDYRFNQEQQDQLIIDSPQSHHDGSSPGARTTPAVSGTLPPALEEHSAVIDALPNDVSVHNPQTSREPSDFASASNNYQAETTLLDGTDENEMVMNRKIMVQFTSKIVRAFKAFISNGIRRKASVWDMEAWINLSLTLDGRDKITKLVQYIARFLSWSLPATLVAIKGRLDALKSSLSTSRKAFRLGRSVLEWQALSSMGLVERWQQYYRQTIKADLEETSSSSLPPLFPPSVCYSKQPQKSNPKQSPHSALHQRSLLRRISTNIGLDYERSVEIAKRLLRQQSFVIDQLRRMPSRLSFLLQEEESDENNNTLPLWQTCLAAIKLASMIIYYAGDNLSFLSAAGVLDNYRVAEGDERRARQKRLTDWANRLANRADLVSGVAGLILSWTAYRDFCREQELQREEHKEEEDEGSTRDNETLARKEMRFALLLSLLKNACDVFMFANQSGVDLFKKALGVPLNEGLYCAAGIMSAAAVLCCKFPPSIQR
ncbi:hypothetical protein ACA910_019557 [Epithemia clementina (nom. ined.)]